MPPAVPAIVRPSAAVPFHAAALARVLAGVLALALTLVPTAPAGAAQAGDPVGGPRLGGKGVVVAPGTPAVPAVAAAAWLVADLDSGEVLAAKDPHGRYAPASTLKTLTAVTLIPELPADRRVTATFDDVDVEGSRVGIVEHVSYPVAELFSALLMVSGNDAANVLASAAGGQVRTAELMNAKAAQLHALDTHAVNPHGLDAVGQTSSAYDLALIARAGLADPDFARYVGTVSSSISAPNGTRFEMRNKNKLLGRYPGALGVKNGYTTAARASFVGAAERGGRRLVVTLMRSDPRVFDEAVTLLDWGFKATSASPVGVLVDPLKTSPASRGGGRTSAAAEISGTASSAARAPGPANAATQAFAPAQEDEDGSGTGLPVTVAGLTLAAAALFAVRSPTPSRRRTSSHPVRRSRPARAPGTRPAARRPTSGDRVRRP